MIAIGEAPQYHDTNVVFLCPPPVPVFLEKDKRPYHDVPAASGVGGRGRGRGRSRGREVEPAARAGHRSAEPAAAVLTSSGAPLVVLPGEKLSRVAPAAPPPTRATATKIFRML